MKNKIQLRFIIALLFLFAFILSACGDRRGLENNRDVKDTIDFAGIPDGTYRGLFTYGAFNYILDVVTEDGKVTDIIIVQNKDNEPSRTAEAVLDRIIEAQSLEVDHVSGATASSKALHKAVENALKSAIKE